MQTSVINHVWIFIACVVLLLVAGTLWCYNRRTRYFHDFQTCHYLLKSSTLVKRAGPNERLKIAFGIENAFTTTDHEFYLKYRGSITKKLVMKDTDEGRIQIAAEAFGTIQQYLRQTQDDVSLEQLVKVTVFQTIFSIFFPEAPQPSILDAEVIAEMMDSLWYDSKSPTKIFVAKHIPSISAIIKKRRLLHLKLKQLFRIPSNDLFPRKNPLNVLLPGYIGLWRVVLKAFIEIRFRSTPQNREAYIALLSTFITTPNAEIWYKSNTSGVSTQSIIAESLRLYPPTRRIYTLGDDGITRAVDVEALHRSGKIWGENVDSFGPERWNREGLNVNNTKEYMPFGAKGLSISRCPSRRRGGPKLCAVLLGVLVGEIGDGWELVDGEGRPFELPPGSLGNGRVDFARLQLRGTLRVL